MGSRSYGDECKFDHSGKRTAPALEVPAGEEEDEFPEDEEPSEESHSHLGVCVYDAMSVIVETSRERRLIKARDKTIASRPRERRVTFGDVSTHRFRCDTVTERYDYRPKRKHPPRSFETT